MGSSLWLRLVCAGEAEGRFELHAHSWSDTGRKSRHTHTLHVGEWRFVPAEERRGRTDEETPAALWLMPTATWGSSTQPPIEWTDTARFHALPRESTSALALLTLHGTDAITVQGRRLALRTER